ncbi:MAG: hypothetical protein ACYSW8_30450 [Planctomycetota bacterium]|jgi:hypothetical protein
MDVLETQRLRLKAQEERESEREALKLHKEWCALRDAKRAAYKEVRRVMLDELATYKRR